MRFPELSFHNLSESISSIVFRSSRLAYELICAFDLLYVRTYIFRAIYLSLIIGTTAKE